MNSLSVISVVQRLVTLVSVITLSGLNACASTTPVAYQGLSSARALTPQSEDLSIFSPPGDTKIGSAPSQDGEARRFVRSSAQLPYPSSGISRANK
jgi:hypothetical protein